jgi:integrase
MTKAKARRTYGTGSVYQRKDGRWMGTVDAGYTASGGRYRPTVSAKTEAEAKTKLKELQRRIATEGAAPASASVRTTVKAWSAQWLDMTKRTLRPKPWGTDQGAVRKWIVPTIGHKRLADLTPADVRAVADAQRKAGRSTSTAHRTHATLHTMLVAARQEGHQIPARVLDVKAPAIAVSDRDAMPIAHALAMLAVASFLPHGSRWAMAFLHGLRQAECLGVTRDCIDLDAGSITVEWQLQPLPYIDRANKALGYQVPDGFDSRHLIDAWHLTRPKTKKGFRVVPLIPAMREALTDWLAIAPENPWGLVWPTATGRPANMLNDRHEWYALQDTASVLGEIPVAHYSGRRYFLHEARHTTATVLLEEGIDPHQVTAIMGHSSILTTRGYQHPSQRAGLAALEAVGGRLELG